MITELAISHYKSITDEVVKLDDVNVLIGKNGSGKSNIVDALSFLSDIATDDLDFAITKRHGSDSIRQWSKFKPYNITLAVKIKSDIGEGYYKIVLSSSRNSYRVLEEIIEWDGESTYSEDRYKTTLRRYPGKPIEIESNYDQDDIDFDEVRNLKIDSHDALLSKKRYVFHRLNWILGYVFSEIRSLSTFSIFPNTIRAPQSVSRGTALETDGRNIASIIKQLGGDRRRKIVKSLKVVMPQLDNITIKSTAGYYVPVFLVRGSGSEVHHELNMSQVSDGTLRILGILTALFQPNAPSKIVLEEPEQMIHPALLIVIRDAILEYLRSNEASQVFLTTHSSVLLDLFDVNKVIAVEFCKGSTKCGPVSERQKAIVKSGLMTLGDVLLAEDLEIA